MLGRRAARWATVGLVIAGLVVGIGAYAYAKDDTRATVVRVVDGDTLVARVAGVETVIRLLNIDTPETKDPNEPVQCLGPEASQYLDARLPAGIEVKLAYDQDRFDPYGRTLAAVYESNSLVNAEIAARGLGVAVVYQPNRKFYKDVYAAELSAREQRRGLYDPQVACSVPAQWEAALAIAPAVAEPNFDSSAQAVTAVTHAGASFARFRWALLALRQRGDGESVDASVYHAIERDYSRRSDEANARAETAYKELLVERDRLQAAEEAAKREAAKRAAARKEAAKRAAARKEAAARAKERQRAAERAAKARAERNSRQTSAPAPKKRQSGHDNRRGYTGPRCYAPGGKTWRPCP